jgi:hypothetical protein
MIALPGIQPQVTPPYATADLGILLQVEHPHHVVGAPQMVHLQIDHRLPGVLRPVELQGPDIGGGEGFLQHGHPGGGKVRQPIVGHQGLAREGDHRGPGPSQPIGHGRPDEENVRVGVPGDVVKERPSLRGRHSGQEAPPGQGHVSAGSSAVEDPRSFDGRRTRAPSPTRRARPLAVQANRPKGAPSPGKNRGPAGGSLEPGTRPGAFGKDATKGQSAPSGPGLKRFDFLLNGSARFASRRSLPGGVISFLTCRLADSPRRLWWSS